MVPEKGPEVGYEIREWGPSRKEKSENNGQIPGKVLSYVEYVFHFLKKEGALL